MARHHWPPGLTWKAMQHDMLPPLIGRDAVCALTGWTCSTLLTRARTGNFVKPQISYRSGSPVLRWETKQVAQWLAANGFDGPSRGLSWRGNKSGPWHECFRDVIHSVDTR
jgi:hypothetical protein